MATVKQIQDRGRLVRLSKSPRTSAPHFGIEIEFLSRESEESVCAAFARARLHSLVQLGYDGSVCRSETACNGERCADVGWNRIHSLDCDRMQPKPNGYELRACVPASDVSTIVPRICAVLASIDASVNKTCGLHVHIDTRKRDEDRSFRSLVHCLPILWPLVDSSRRDNSYCEPNPCSCRGCSANDEKYLAVNGDTGLPTIEVRMHEGTIDANQIVHWCILLGSIADANLTSEVKTKTEFRRAVKAPLATLKHFGLAKRRVSKRRAA